MSTMVRQVGSSQYALFIFHALIIVNQLNFASVKFNVLAIFELC